MDVIDGAWIKKRLPAHRGAKSELARAMGLKPEMVTRILKGERQVQAAEIPKVLEFFSEFETPAPAGVDLADEPGRSEGETVMVPVYDVRVSAGSGLIPDDYVSVTEEIAFARDFIRRILRVDPRHLAMITIWGDSMEPTLISGDLAFMTMGEGHFDVEGIYVFRHDRALHVKRVIRSARPGHILAIPDNDYYPRQEYPIDEITVIGKIIFFAGMLRPRVAR